MNRLALLIVLILLTPSLAQATCGDWLAHAKTSEYSTTSDSTAVSALELLKSTAAPTAPLRVPCSGPSCRQAPQQPAAPETPPVSLQQEIKLVVIASRSTAMDTDREFARRQNATDSVLEGFRLLIERPPRIA